MRILVTGVGGFVSSSVYRALINKYPNAEIVGTTHYSQYNYENHPERGKKNNIVVECVLEKKAWTDRLLSQFKPDVIFHISGIGTQSSPPQLLFDSHVISTLNLLSSLDQENKPLFIHMSSIVVNSRPFNLYAAAKASAEAIVKSYNDMSKITGVSVRSCAVVGGRSKHGLLPDIVSKLMDDKQINLELRSNSIKPFIFIDTLVDFLLKLINNVRWQENSPISISGCGEISVEDVAKLAMDIIEKYKTIIWKGESFAGDQSRVSGFNNIDWREYATGSSLYNVEQGIKDILKKNYGVKL